MFDSLGYLFYPVVFGAVLWSNNGFATEEHGFLKAGGVSLFECFAMFGSWLVAIRLGVFAALTCCLVIALALAVAGMTAQRQSPRRRAGVSGGILLTAWGGLSAVVAGVVL